MFYDTSYSNINKKEMYLWFIFVLFWGALTTCCNSWKRFGGLRETEERDESWRQNKRQSCEVPDVTDLLERNCEGSVACGLHL